MRAADSDQLSGGAQAMLAVGQALALRRKIPGMTDRATNLARGIAVYAGDSAALMADREELQNSFGASEGGPRRADPAKPCS